MTVPDLPTAASLRRMADLAARGEQVDPAVLRAAADELGRVSRALESCQEATRIAVGVVESWKAAHADLAAIVDAQGQAVELLRLLREEIPTTAVPRQYFGDIDRVLAAVDRPHEQERQ